MPLSVAQAAVKSVQAVGTPITPAIIKYQQTEANTFQQLGLIPKRSTCPRSSTFPTTQAVAKQAGLKA